MLRDHYWITYFFPTSAPCWPNIFSITEIKVMNSRIATNRPDRLSRLRAFPI